jgi:zinc metalloprotease ZmpB
VNPQMSVPGGKTKASMTIHGGLERSTNTLQIDTTALPADSRVEVRTLTRLIDAATLSDLAPLKAGAVRSTLQAAGGVDAGMADFPLAASEDATLDLLIDFSHNAEHLRTYPLVVSQWQDGRLVGRVTVDIVAIKELEDYFFGNPRSGEIHVTTCPFWPALGPGSKIPFVRVEDAVARGYNGCAYCLPAHDRG